MTADPRLDMLAEVQAERRALDDELVELRGRIAHLCGYYCRDTDGRMPELLDALRQAAGLRRCVVLDQGEVTELDAESRQILRDE